ncbi:MAG: NADH-quinone oxidoreductase subunit A [bacterium]|nr:NADH-quinone oxidoreductase subunit A [bacterium]
MLFNFGVAATFLVVMAAFLGVNLLVARLLSPQAPSAEKAAPYDCGEAPVGVGYRQFNLRFYLVALIFVIFDVEIAFMYPVTVVFKDLTFDGYGSLAFVEIGIFVLILTVGFVYAWSVGALDWVREQLQEETKS